VAEVPEPLSQTCRSRVKQCGGGAGANMWRRYRTSTVLPCPSKEINKTQQVHIIQTVQGIIDDQHTSTTKNARSFL
jgi:hypothetical protein